MILFSLALFVLAILGAPLFSIIVTSAMIGLTSEDTDLMNVALDILGIADLPFLVAIPLFTFAGYLLSESQAPKRLVRMTGSLLGWMPGGLAVVSLFACAFFYGIYGRFGRHDYRFRRDLVPGVATGRLPGSIQPGPGDVLRQPRSAVRTITANYYVWRCF